MYNLAMKIIIGLGNPGPEYAGTRHNAGMMLVERLATSAARSGDYGWRREKSIMVAKFENLILVKTGGVFMNESGKMIHDLRFKNYELGDLYLAHDDLDIKLGEYKIQKGVGPKVHNGVQSVEKALGTKDFWRVRIGIETRRVEERESISGEQFVLQRFRTEEKEILESVLEKISNEIFKTIN
jgi:PTH1 family peptidyl-tRNA hydrolase